MDTSSPNPAAASLTSFQRRRVSADGEIGVVSVSGRSTLVASAASEYNRGSPESSPVALVFVEEEIIGDAGVPTTCSSGEIGCGAGGGVGGAVVASGSESE